MKHKLIRLTALIMAVIMCIPTNITALAAETTATEAQQTAYTAAISPAEHGKIVFTGKVLAKKNTTDNRFTFYMPEKNVTISASFSEEGAESSSENASDESGTSDYIETGNGIWERRGCLWIF